MLTKLIVDFFKKAVWGKIQEKGLGRLLKEAKEAYEAGELRDAKKLFEKYLASLPEDQDALNTFGVCLADIGETERAHAVFRLAYGLDDSNVVAVLNHARYLVDERKITQALPELIRAQVMIAESPHVATIMSGVSLGWGDAEGAKGYSLRAWLSNFENIRLANGHMFSSAYSDMPEESLAAEHAFWAETCAPLSYKLAAQDWNFEGDLSHRKMRIGYWSPDLRNHSVRYFFRPLLEGHDRDRVELILYHDSIHTDEQTEKMRACCDQFHETFHMKDKELGELISSHKLDVLVELAGHTSFNRLHMLRQRMAHMQVTGIGYPFSTGLPSIDAKMLDPFIFTPDACKYYAEQPLVLPQSFWCYDPKTEISIPDVPPVLKNGYVTFGCPGNVGKINEKVMHCWAEILRRVPRSRMVIRGVSLSDSSSIDSMLRKLVMAGLKKEQIQLLPPTSGPEFFTSYNDIDIVLDTHPFNGGTTTCFAVYMGVPVVTWRGESLLSRMGHSVLSNVGAADLVVRNAQEYISRAVELSQDIEYLKRFRREVRGRMARGSLGDGTKFAEEFENACRGFLRERAAGKEKYVPELAALPATELIRRAGTVLAYGHKEAALRIVDYCLQHYPDFAPAHILLTDKYTSEGEFEDAAGYLLERLHMYGPSDQAALLINIVRFLILAGKLPEAGAANSRLESIAEVEPHEKLQMHLYRASLPRLPVAKNPAPENRDVAQRKLEPEYARIQVIIPCDDSRVYDMLEEHMRKTCTVPQGSKIQYTNCSEAGRTRAYRTALDESGADMVVMLQRNVVVYHPDFFLALGGALRKADIVGYSGATRWNRFDWELDEFSQKAAGFLSPSSEQKGYWEAHVVGDGADVIKGGLCLLAGDLLAVRPANVLHVAFDRELVGGGGLLEQVWSYEAGRAGCRLAVHRNLGVSVSYLDAAHYKYLAMVRVQVVEKMKFDVLALLPRDRLTINVPCATAEDAVQTMDRYWAAESA